MGVDAFLVDRLNHKAGDARIFLQQHRHVANQIFDEDRIIISLHGHVALVRPLEQSIHRSGR